MQLFPQGVPPIKRCFDLAITLLGLIVVLPLMGVIALWIRLINGNPVVFTQDRPGLKEKIFSMYKFRTMSLKTRGGDKINPAEDAQRITRTGKFLRATSLDELPELINVLKGEMSLVGPRPLLAVYLERYSPEQARRQDVLPGITGWAQVNGRNMLSWEERFQQDVWYVDHWTLGLDIKILAITVWKVIKREGISPNGQVISDEFMGSTEKPTRGPDPQ